MKKTITNMAQSVHQRLLNAAKGTDKPFNMFLQHYAIERFLFRVANSGYAEKFLLKGALLLKVWRITAARPTMDIDILRRTNSKDKAVGDMLKDCMTLKVEDDGLIFHPETLVKEVITANAEYQGERFKFLAKLGNAKIMLQVDVGIGDSVYPSPAWVDYPSILEQERPHLLAYAPESMIAEKYSAMVALEMANSRMKDFYDIWILANELEFKGSVLSQAIKKTFERRKIELPSAAPICFESQFYESAVKKIQWKAFVNKLGLKSDVPPLSSVIEVISSFLTPPTLTASADKRFELNWLPKGPWRQT